MKYSQKSFAGGLNTIILDTAIPTDAYTWGINVRSRFGHADPINRHKLLTDAPKGNYQGCIGVGNVLVLFVSGKAYYRLEDVENPTFINIPLVNMDPHVSQIFSCSVPSSYFNFFRKTAVNKNIEGDLIVTTEFRVAGTPQAVVLQDGKSRPFLIIFNEENQTFTSRQAHDYNMWNNKSVTQDDREYVPIGREMMYMNGVLFIIAPDRKSIYRSVTGRPLDFMVNVDPNGNKLAAEELGGADTVSFAFDFDEITCLKPVSIPSSFVYATHNTVRIITMDYTNTIFGEPTFFVSSRIGAGVINNKSFVDITGDYAFIDREGVISFDAVQQLMDNGRSSVFSLPLSKYLKGKKQYRSMCFTAENYAIFNLDTM